MATDTPSAPEVIGPYRVLRPIARGGMSEVYEVEDSVSGERFALKLLAQQGTALPRFNREYEALTRLNHPCIVRVYHYGFHNGAPWLTMELLAGVPMQARVKTIGKPGTKTRTEEVIRVVTHVADALQYIHDRGLVHRDLKSDNVVVLPDGRVKLLDFGTARVDDPLEPITREGEFVGTFAYASPEQLTGGVVDHRSDLYSLGVLMYRLCTGQRLFEATDPLQLARLHAKTPPRPPRELVPELPSELEKVILWLLQKKADARPSRARVVADALRAMAGRPDAPTLEIVASPDQVVGREAELVRAMSRIEAAGSGGAVLIEGGEGSGRTKFVRAVSLQAESRGWMVVNATIDEGRPLASLFEALEHAAEVVKKSPRADVRAAAEVIRRQCLSGELEGAGRKREAVRLAAGQVLSACARQAERPVLVCVQHLHLAGPLGLDFLAAVRREVAVAEPPIRIVASVREGSDEQDVLVRQRLPDADRIVLGALSVRDVALTMGNMLHRRPPPADLARRIHEASAGQPAYVEEVVRYLVKSGQLAVRGLDGNRLEWTERESARLPIALTARQAVDRALRRLPAFERRVLEALCVIGESAAIETLASGLSFRVPEIAGVVSSLVDRGWVRFVDEEERRIGWVSALVPIIVSEHLHPCRRDVLLRRVVDAVRREPCTPDKVRVLLATSNVEEAALDAARAAGELLIRGSPNVAAEMLDEIVKRLADIRPASPERFVDVYVQHARCLQLVRPTDPQLARSLAKAWELAATDDIKAQIGFLRARLQLVIGHYPNYRKHLQEAWEFAGRADVPRLSSTLAAHLAQSFMWVGQPRTATEWFESAREAAHETENPVVIAYTDAAVAPFAMSRGDLVQAEQLSRDAMEQFQRANHPRGYWGALSTWANALREQGRFSEALAILHANLPVVRDAESASHYVSLLLTTARCEVDLYRLGRAQECVDELEATVRAGEHMHVRLDTMLIRGRILLASGQYDDARTVLHDALQRARNAGLTSTAETARALSGETAWYLGLRDEARELFRNACLGLMGNGDVLALAEACAVRARTVAEEEDPAVVFQPVASFVEGQPAILLRTEMFLARARHLRAKGDAVAAFRACRAAATLVNQVAAKLNDTDRAVLRVHPWSRQIRHGLKV